jgi:tRNA-splicing ligase RtcB
MKAPYKVYGTDYIEQGAFDQFYSAMELPWVTRGALMADAHFGYSLPIGGVVETDGMIVPSWVGYDIGCGVCAIRTSFEMGEVMRNTDLIYDAIKQSIPVGFHHNTRPVSWTGYQDWMKTPWFNEMFKEKGGLKQLGTLGGGNHFIEVGYSNKDMSIWIVIHSGSRNVGHTTAQNYMAEAAYIVTGRRKASEGHFPLEMTSGLGIDYIMDQKICLEFALANRTEMIKRIQSAMMQSGCSGGLLWDTLINRTHNHAEVKNGKVIHRKGATHAEEGMLGVIPGNMRDGSFIVKGKGCQEALCSSSHGAGRVLGRKKAKETLDVRDFRDTMAGIKCHADKDNIDESPGAYKDINVVMAEQSDLVEIIDHIKPIINVKG